MTETTPETQAVPVARHTPEGYDVLKDYEAFRRSKDWHALSDLRQYWYEMVWRLANSHAHEARNYLDAITALWTDHHNDPAYLGRIDRCCARYQEHRAKRRQLLDELTASLEWARASSQAQAEAGRA